MHCLYETHVSSLSAQEYLCVLGVRFKVVFLVLLGCPGHQDPFDVVRNTLFVIWTNFPL